MLLLATNAPHAKHSEDGERITLCVPNGSETVEIAMTFYQAMEVARTVRQAIGSAIDTANREALPSAEIIAFPKRSVA